MIRMTLILCMMLCGLGAMSQKLGKVTVEELAETKFPGDTSAPAAILFKKSNSYFMTSATGYWTVVTETEMKIKIYKKQGYEYANHQVFYKVGARADNVNYTDAATYNLVNGKVEKTKLKSEGEFNEETAKEYHTRKISFPNVKEGSIVEFKLKQTTYNIVDIDNFYFQSELPTKFAECKFSAPAKFVYNKYMGGFLKPTITYDTFTDHASGVIQNRFTATLQDIPAMKDEEFVSNINNYRSRMMLELSSATNGDGFIEKMATSWPDVTKNLYELEDFGPQLRKSGYFEDDLPKVIAGATDFEDKIRKVYRYVQDRMTWNERNGIVCDQGVSAAYKAKTGNVAEINFILTAMLREAGVNANPVLVSTRKHGIALFPSRTAFNYIITAVENGQHTILLDATSKYAQPDLLPFRCLNWNGRMIRKDGTSKEVDLMPRRSSKEVISMVAKLEGSGTITGQVRDVYADYNAMAFRSNYYETTADGYLEKLEQRHQGLEIANHKITEGSSVQDPVTEAYDFTHNNAVEIIGDKMYFNPMLFFARKENPFTQEKRSYPVDFMFPYKDKFLFTIMIPEGYEVESVPQPGSYVLPGNEMVFRYSISSNPTQIQISVNHDLNTTIFAEDNYESLKTFYKEMVSKQNEKVVLKKV